MRQIFFLLLFPIILSCSKEKQNISDCSEIKLPFKSYSEAQNTVQSVDFKIEDKVNTSKSSWIRGAKYYSCDGRRGYFIFSTDKKDYIHEGVPIEIWEGFKNAESFGKFYNQNLKHNYTLIPSKERLNIEFIREDIFRNLNISDNFSPEIPIFNELAEYIGSTHFHTKDVVSVPLTILEKLEILCKKAREYADEESYYLDNYSEIKFIELNRKFKLENTLETILYDSVELLGSNLVKVEQMGSFGIIDNVGKEILPVVYSEIYLLNKDFIVAKKNSYYNLFTLQPVSLMDNVEDVHENFNPFGQSDKYFWIKKKGLWGLFNNKLNQIIPFKLDYDDCELISDNASDGIYIKVTKAGKTGLISGLLNKVIINLDPDIEDIIMKKPKSFVITRYSTDNSETFNSSSIEENLKSEN